MSNDAETVLNAALALPPETRGEIAGRLLESLEDRPDFGLTPEQAADIERRIDDVRSGRAKLIPADEVFDTILRRIREGKRGA